MKKKTITAVQTHSLDAQKLLFFTNLVQKLIILWCINKYMNSWEKTEILTFIIIDVGNHIKHKNKKNH